MNYILTDALRYGLVAIESGCRVLKDVLLALQHSGAH